MGTENMRMLMEAARGYVEVDENFVTEPEQPSLDSPPGDAFRDSEPAQPMTVVANVDIPAMYMNAGDELYLEPTNNQGEAYSEENGLTYEWDFIFHLIRDKNMLDFKEDTEVAFDEGIAGDAIKDVVRTKFQNKVTDKDSILRMVNNHVESTIMLLDLGLKDRNSEDTEFLLELMARSRKELIELQKWIRNRDKY